MVEWLNAPMLKPKTWVQVSTWSSLLSNQHYIESRILIFFRLRQNGFEYFLFDTRYDQRVSGFILCKDIPKTRFSRPQAIGLVFFLLPLEILNTRIFWRTLEVVTYARVLPWPNGYTRQYLHPNTWVQLLSTVLGHHFYQTNCCAHVLIEWFGNTPGANKGDWLQRNALGTRISNSASWLLLNSSPSV